MATTKTSVELKMYDYQFYKLHFDRSIFLLRIHIYTHTFSFLIQRGKKSEPIRIRKPGMLYKEGRVITSSKRKEIYMEREREKDTHAHTHTRQTLRREKKSNTDNEQKTMLLQNQKLR